MIITKDQTYKDTNFYSKFTEIANKKEYKSIQCEVNFEAFTSIDKNRQYKTVRVWFKGDLYGTSYIFTNYDITIKRIDDLCSAVAVKLDDFKNEDDIVVFLLNDIKDNYERHK